ncbi:hypothetical protein FSP39_022238 [Pinctada imbricata]|uniref:thiopurine S-methyltransferase n=1 Tax=Pinctada imbricata TaxID=66713 RepID=A0AA88Y0R8_PINIB|nr:hypothetical protein FSP39_022238 [Pinctada imbricata]
MEETSMKYTEMTVNDWDVRWHDRKIGFHKNTIHPLLDKHVEKLIAGRTNIKIFFPLCGKAIDMKWLSDKGHTVIGVEGSEMAIQEFFQEQNMKFNTVDVPSIGGKLFTSEDNKIRLYCADFYLFNSELEGKVDAVWDRGAMVAINRCDRPKYVSTMKPLISENCKYFLDTLVYDETKYPGAFCDVELIDDIDAV